MLQFTGRRLLRRLWSSGTGWCEAARCLPGDPCRQFITLPAKSLGGILLYTLAGEPIRAQDPETGDKKVAKFYPESEVCVIEAAAADRIFPSDESGPGAKQAAVVIFIRRPARRTSYGKDKYRSQLKAPFVESLPEHGYNQGEADAARSLSRRDRGTFGGSLNFQDRAQSQCLLASSDFTQFLPRPSPAYDRGDVQLI